jgi:hypothetical protein
MQAWISRRWNLAGQAEQKNLVAAGLAHGVDLAHRGRPRCRTGHPIGTRAGSYHKYHDNRENSLSHRNYSITHPPINQAIPPLL